MAHGCDSSRLVRWLYREQVGGKESVLVISGEVDTATAPRWQEELDRVLHARPSLVVVDLAGVSFMDSSGINLLVMARKRALAQDTRVIVRDPSSRVDRLLRMNGIRDLF